MLVFMHQGYALILYKMTNLWKRSKFKGFVDDKMKVAKILIPVFNKVENIVGTGENASYQHFLFPSMLLKGFFFRFVKSLGVRGKRLNLF